MLIQLDIMEVGYIVIFRILRLLIILSQRILHPVMMVEVFIAVILLLLLITIKLVITLQQVMGVVYIVKIPTLKLVLILSAKILLKMTEEDCN